VAVSIGVRPVRSVTAFDTATPFRAAYGSAVARAFTCTAWVPVFMGEVIQAAPPVGTICEASGAAVALGRQKRGSPPWRCPPDRPLQETRHGGRGWEMNKCVRKYFKWGASGFEKD
jgi:hypothetical protein